MVDEFEAESGSPSCCSLDEAAESRVLHGMVQASEDIVVAAQTMERVPLVAEDDADSPLAVR
jgi:hypothetical protein